MDSAMHMRTAEFLGTEDVASWQAVDVSTQKVFATLGGYNVWKSCAELQFPFLFGDVSLYQGENRQVFLRCHARMLRASYALGDILVIDDVADAAFLSEQLRACTSHREHVLFGEFDLTRPVHPTSFEFGVNGKSSLAGLPAGILKLMMVLNGNKLMARAIYGNGRPFSFRPFVEADRVHLKLNVASADQRIAMSVHGMALTLDGTWRTSELDSSFKDNRNGQLATSVLCVLTLTDCSYSTIVHTSSEA